MQTNIFRTNLRQNHFHRGKYTTENAINLNLQQKYTKILGIHVLNIPSILPPLTFRLTEINRLPRNWFKTYKLTKKAMAYHFFWFQWLLIETAH